MAEPEGTDVMKLSDDEPLPANQVKKDHEQRGQLASKYGMLGAEGGKLDATWGKAGGRRKGDQNVV